MKRIHKKIAVAIASGAVLLGSFTPVFADTTIEISGNGADSDNTADVKLEQSTDVVQSNNADIFNKVDASADTGNNDANKNTGGDVDIKTGDATTEVSVETSVNTNMASVNCCPSGDTELLISGNGYKSDNDIKYDQKSETFVGQFNDAKIKNKVYADSDTGNNDANKNTGGDVTIETGDAWTGVVISNSANANSARVGGNGSGGSGLISARILGNGADSKNKIDLDLKKKLEVVQANEADVFNKVDADSDTGNNDANENTGGDVTIETGDASTGVGIDNMVNFNFADVDCGCLLDLLAKIAGNGADSDNDIKAKLDDKLGVFQSNCGDLPGVQGDHENHKEECELDNIVDADSDTGDNDANKNTGDPDGDPSVETGDAETEVELSNSGNVNAYGEDVDLELPGGFSFNFNFSLDLSDLLDLLGL